MSAANPPGVPAPPPIIGSHCSLTRHVPRVDAVAIGVSTGGPQALAELLPGLSADLPVPVFIVQHMPPMFTRLLAERLQASCELPVKEAADGMIVRSGEVLLAAGDRHMKVRMRGASVVVELTQEPAVNFCRPSVDVLFRSVADVYGSNVLAVMLTGMGSDGLAGVRELKHRGAFSLAQDRASSIVWGMPGAVVEAGLADRVLPLKEIGPEIVRMVEGIEV